MPNSPSACALVAASALASAAGAQQFVQQTATRFPVQAEYSNQCTVVDIEGDGDLDIVWANGQGYSAQGAALQLRIYVNDGAGNFTDESATRAPGITGWFRGVEAGDVDGDGDWDLLVANDFNKRPLLLLNIGAGVFVDQSLSRLPLFALSSARGQFGDVDNDGDLDIALCNNGASRFGSGQPRLYLNNGLGVFTDATGNLPTGNVAEQMDILFLDVDNDHDLDLFLGTRASSPNQSRLWKNDGTGRYALQPGIPNDGSAYSYDAGDIDGDGDLDLIGINAGPSSSELLLRNNGDGTAWTNVSSSIAPNPSVDDNDSRFIDVDMDGDLDLVVGSLGGRERLYLNNGAGAFAENTALFPAVSDSTLDIKVADFNADGRLDVITAQGESGSFQNRIYMNTSGPADNRAPRVRHMEQVVPGAESGLHPVRATIFDEMTSDRGFHAREVRIRWRAGGGPEGSAPMPWNGNNQWRGIIPPQAPGVTVEYWVTAVDWAGNVGTGLPRTFTEAGTANPADLDHDGRVGGSDLAIMLGSWGPCAPPCPPDLTGNGMVEGADLAELLSRWSP